MRGIYLFPSLITLGNLSSGFLALLFVFQERFMTAAWAILVAITFDIFDGRIARWTQSTSRFGIELDSLADLVSFGVAPAFLIYQLILQNMSKPGVAIALFFVICAALRLARFNLKAAEEKEVSTTDFFIGLPVPAAAGITASFVIVYELFLKDENHRVIPILMERVPYLYRLAPLGVVLLSFLMVSHLRYTSFKGFKLSGRKPLQTLILVAVSLLLIFAYPQNIIFIVFFAYVTSGVIDYLWRLYRLRRRER